MQNIMSVIEIVVGTSTNVLPAKILEPRWDPVGQCLKCSYGSRKLLYSCVAKI